MKVLFDTSVIVPSLAVETDNHDVAADCVATYSGARHTAFCSTHALAECYSTLSSLPLKPRIQPMQARELVTENILGRFEVIDLTSADYEKAISRVATLGLASGVIYDALHLGCAERLGCKRLYTWNIRDFERLQPEGVAVVRP